MYGFSFKELITFGRGPRPQDYKIRIPAARIRRYLSDQSLNNDANFSISRAFQSKAQA